MRLPALRVADARVDDARLAIERELEPPEAAAGERRDGGAVDRADRRQDGARGRAIGRVREQRMGAGGRPSRRYGRRHVRASEDES